MEDLLRAFRANTKEFIELIKSIPDEYLNSKPDEETWSPAENVEHIIRSEFGTVRLFNGETDEDSDRNSERLIQKMETIFLNRDRKVKASGVVLPTNDEKDKDELIDKFKSSREKVTELIKSQDLDEVCKKYKHPVFGFLTRREWIHFNMVHAKRHSLQIKEVLQSFK